MCLIKSNLEFGRRKQNLDVASLTWAFLHKKDLREQVPTPWFLTKLSTHAEIAKPTAPGHERGIRCTWIIVPHYMLEENYVITSESNLTSWLEQIECVLSHWFARTTHDFRSGHCSSIRSINIYDWRSPRKHIVLRKPITAHLLGVTPTVRSRMPTLLIDPQKEKCPDSRHVIESCFSFSTGTVRPCFMQRTEFK